MNRVFLIGNLTHDPQLRTTQSGIPVCSFTIAVNRRKPTNGQAGQPDADFFRVTAWRGLAESCGKWLIKGRKVSVVGSVSVSTYQAQNGETRAQMEVHADDVEFLTPGNQAPQGDTQTAKAAANPVSGGFTQVDEDELPFD